MCFIELSHIPSFLYGAQNINSSIFYFFHFFFLSSCQDLFLRMSFSTYCDPLSEFPKLPYVLDDVRIIKIFHITLYLSMIDTEEKMVYDKKKKKFTMQWRGYSESYAVRAGVNNSRRCIFIFSLLHNEKLCLKGNSFIVLREFL